MNPKKFADTFHKAKRYWLTGAFFLGFFTDLLLLNRVDDVFDNIILLFYVVLATASLLLFYLGVSEKGPVSLNHLLLKYMPILMQYSFGGLLSGMLIFYGRSGDWLVSAPFLLLIIGVIAGNELVQKRSNKLLFHLILYFIGLFSYVVLVVPVVIGKMGDLVFVISGLVALSIVIGVVRLLYQIVPNFMEHNTKSIIVTLGFLFIGLNALYFSNVIPPIPLSLTELTIVHSVERQADGNYLVVAEDQPWWQVIPFTKPVIHPSSGTVACFARVFAPTRLHTEIYHRWEYLTDIGTWEERLRLGYPIQGSNSQGYRGYTTISNLEDGTWRCGVETERGQVLGRQRFVIDRQEEAEEIVTVIK